MATDSSPLSLDTLHGAIEDAIRARFPDFAGVAFYPLPSDGAPPPACALAMTRCDRSKDSTDGSGQMQALLRFEARITASMTTAAAALALRRSAVALATWLHQLGRFPGAPSGAIDVIAALPDATPPADTGSGTWIVEWSLPVALGEDAWKDSGGDVPHAVYSIAPQIGFGHEAHYAPVTGATP